MPKKHIEIEVLELETESRFQTIYPQHISDPNFGGGIPAGYTYGSIWASGVPTLNHIGYAMTPAGAPGYGAGDSPTNQWQGVGYCTAGTGLGCPPGPGLMANVSHTTPVPVATGGSMTFPQSTATPSVTPTEQIVNYEFDDNITSSSTQPLFNNTPSIAEAKTPGMNPGVVGDTIGESALKQKLGVAPTITGWRRFGTVCGATTPPQSNPDNNPRLQGPPSKNGYLGNWRAKLATSQDCTTTSGEFGSNGLFYPFPSGTLTAGQEYVLRIVIAAGDTVGGGAKFRLGNAAAKNSVGGLLADDGNRWQNLGGDNADIYYDLSGNGGPGEYWSQDNVGQSNQQYFSISPSLNGQVQAREFTAVAGYQFLYIEYITGDGGTANYGSNIYIESISIMANAVGGVFNNSGVYALTSLKDPLSGVLGTGPFTLSFDLIAAPNINGASTTLGSLSSLGISICSQANVTSTPTGSMGGLTPLLTAPYVFSNDPTLLGNPLVLGTNTVTFTPNPTDSTGAWDADDRWIDIVVVGACEDGMSNCGDIEISAVTLKSVGQSFTTTVVNTEDSVYGKLEVSNSEDFPFNISYNISDGKNLESRFGDYSQSFDIPATKNNNKVLNHIWDSNIKDDVQTYGIKPCRVLVDNTPFFEGDIQIKKSSHQGTPKSYGCTVYGGNFSWMSKLKDKELCELFDADGSDDFVYDLPTIWTTSQNPGVGSGFPSVVQYPLVSYGDFWVGGPPNYVNNYDDVPVPDWKPGFLVYKMFFRMFNNIGYTIESNFTDSNHFKRLVNVFPFLNHDALDEGVHFSCEYRRRDMQQASGTLQPLHTGSSDSLTDFAGAFHTLELDEQSGNGDPSNSYDPGTGVWTCQRPGWYDFYATGGAYIALYSNTAPLGGIPANVCNSSGPNCQWDFGVLSQDAWIWNTRIKHTDINTSAVTEIGGLIGVSVQQGLFAQYCIQGANANTTGLSGSHFCKVGDTVELQMSFNGYSPAGCTPEVQMYAGYDSVSSTQIQDTTQPSLRINFQSAMPNLGDTINPNSILPCSSQIEWLKSIAHLFNLYFTTDVISKTVYIEPFNDFFKPKAKAVDWTRKVDYSQDIVDDYDIGLKRELEIGYKEDTVDKFMKIQNERAGLTSEATRLYSYSEALGETYQPGKLSMTNPLFAPSSQVWDNDAHDDVSNTKWPILIPNIWTGDYWSGFGLENNQARPQEKVNSFVPRIFYYSYEQNNNFYPNGPNTVNPGGPNTYWSVHKWNNTIETDRRPYPRATFVDWEEKDHTTTMRPSLSFTDESFEAPGSSTVNTVPGLYTMYYKNMIEQLKQAPRIRKVYVDLKLADILNLDMRKLVYLDDSWWRINKVSSFSPAKNQPTQVELIQWKEVGFDNVIIDGTTIKYT